MSGGWLSLPGVQPQGAAALVSLYWASEPAEHRAGPGSGATSAPSCRERRLPSASEADVGEEGARTGDPRRRGLLPIPGPGVQGSMEAMDCPQWSCGFGSLGPSLHYLPQAPRGSSCT